MQVDLTHAILAIVTGPDRQAVDAGGLAPVFRVEDEAERARIAKYIATATLAMVHDLRNGTYLVVKH